MLQSLPNMTDESSFDSIVDHCAYEPLSETCEEIEKVDSWRDQLTKSITSDIVSSTSTPMISNIDSIVDMQSKTSRDAMNLKDKRTLLNDDNFIDIVEYLFRLETKIQNIEMNLSEASIPKKASSNKALSQVTTSQQKDNDASDKEVNESKEPNMVKDMDTIPSRKKEEPRSVLYSSQTHLNEKHVKKEQKTRNKKMVKIRSTATLEEGQLFSVTINEKKILVTVPKGGIQNGDIVKLCLQTHLIKK